MNSIKKGFSYTICQRMTQIQDELEATLNKIFEQAGSNIKSEQQEEYLTAIEETKQVFNHFKIKHGCAFSLTSHSDLYQSDRELPQTSKINSP